ncbi:MAG: hypothetical protein BJ554DRAFT_3392 [Olpidium bornovanus]|uniref:Uncharacterized protein n=1 Tax=Olpidium bornovanus TaxID=278681 RepID=A0A8H7ZPL4_9FUNG|nr:MAG: hypothetical protein BJ554DRAFT_3392 [Olpidium bornovanus]
MPRWRAEIFRDIRSAPTVWQQVCWQCLEVINKLSSELEVISTAARGLLSCEKKIFWLPRSGAGPTHWRRLLVFFCLAGGTASRKKERIVKNLALADPPAHRVGGWQQPAKPPSTFEQRTPSPRKPIKPVESGTIWSPKEPTSPVAQAITSIAAPKPGIPPPIKQIEQLVRRRVTPLATATAADKTGVWARVTRRIRSLPVAHSMLGVDPVLQNRAVYREVQLIVWSTRSKFPGFLFIFFIRLSGSDAGGVPHTNLGCFFPSSIRLSSRRFPATSASEPRCREPRRRPIRDCSAGCAGYP